MNSIKPENFRKELSKLEFISGIIGTAVVNRNGLTILTNLPRNIDERKFGAMAAAMFEAMESASKRISERLMNLTIQYENCQLIIFPVNENIILASLTDLNIDLGLIFIEMEESIKKFQALKRGE